MSRTYSPGADAEFRVVRKRLADGTVKEYRYPRRPAAKAPAHAPGSLDALLAAYRRSPEWAAHEPSTRTNYTIYLRVLERVGHLRVKDIKRRMILELRDAIAAKRGRGAANVFARVTAAVLSWGVDRDWLEYNPAAAIRTIRGGRLPPWTRAETEIALARLPEPLRRVVVLALYTGQRRGDLCAMTWSAYDGRTIRVAQEKGRRRLAEPPPLVIPCHRALRAELDRWKAEGRRSTHILTTARGRPWKPTHLSHEMDKALAAIGLPGRLNVHGLRKLAAANLAEAGCSTKEIAAITGHRTLAMVALYTESAEQERLAQAAITRLETAGTPRKPSE